MKILFLHGWKSVPGGIKPTYLRDHGCEVINPKLDDDDFEMALRTAQMEFDRHNPDVIVGSSRGGAIAMNLNAGDTKRVLLCPAWKKWGAATRVPADTIILHSRADDVVPYQDSVELARVSEATLVEVGHDHRLADPDSLEVMLWACTIAASDQRVPIAEDDSLAPIAPQKDRQTLVREEASYVCDACGEEIVIPLDLTEGSSQTYVEDCPVCCRANIIHVEVDEAGNATVHAQPEQDYD